MTKFGFIILLFINIFYGSIADAEEQVCGAATLDVVAKHLKLKDFYQHDFDTNAGVVVSAACKTTPQDKKIELVAIAYNLPDKNTSQKSVKGNPSADYEKGVIVAMIDNTTKHIISSYQSTIFEDATVEVDSYSFVLDTAAYRLSPNVRAFGLKFINTARVPSCADEWQSDEFQLFVRDGVSLRPVFAVPMSHFLVSKGCVNAGTGMDTLYEEANLTLKVLKSSTNGYADLKLNAAIKTNGSDPIAQTIKPKIEQLLMKYDGKKYTASKKQLPWWLGTNWALQ